LQRREDGLPFPMCRNGQSIALLQNPHDLRFGKPRLLHLTSLLTRILPEKSSLCCLPRGEAYGSINAVRLLRALAGWCNSADVLGGDGIGVLHARAGAILTWILRHCHRLPFLRVVCDPKPGI